MKRGYLLLTLHAHLPYVRHPEHDKFLEERWLFEAIIETYVPLIEMFDRYLEEQIPFRITMSVTPPLASMLGDELLQDRFMNHINQLIKLTESEMKRTKKDPHLNYLAKTYNEHFENVKEVFYTKYSKNLLNAFRKFQDAGCLEIITCGATHGFFPLMQPVQHSVRAQVATACEHYEQVFGRRPQGIWLPECGYYPGYDKILADNGIRYFFVDTHGVLDANPRPQNGVFAPIQSPNGVYAFGRDIESSKQVWSSKEGYPGDVDYREYYRDLGFDADWNYIKPYAHPDGIRINTGIKYHRITGESEYKEYYSPENARNKADLHASNFMCNREKQISHLHEHLGRKPVVVAPYDAELYGHWWYEGPQFLDFLIRKVIYDSPVLELTTAPEYLDKAEPIQPAEPAFSSWGYKGYAEYWLNDTNDWIYRHLHAASEKMNALAQKFQEPAEVERRALNQASRELLLAESSDWAFIMKTGTMVEYAQKRTREHLLRFFKLYDQIQENQIDLKWLEELEERDNIFPSVNYHHYA